MSFQQDLGNVLKRKVSYGYVLIAVLLFITFLAQSQSIFQEKDWASTAANNLHFVLLMAAFVGMVAVDLKRKGAPILEETTSAFAKTIIIGAGWFFIFMALTNGPKDLLEQLFMGIYFFKGAAIEELTFRYSLPRLLNYEGYNYWISQGISNVMFSWCHFFVWNFTLAAAIIGFVFGVATMIAFAYGQSFMGIVVSHTLYNLALAGATALFLLLFVASAVIIYVVRDLRHG